MHCKNALGDSSLQSCKKEISRFVRICVWSYVDYKVCFVTIDHENPNEFQLNILLEKQLYCLCYANYNMKLFNINLFFVLWCCQGGSPVAIFFAPNYHFKTYSTTSGLSNKRHLFDSLLYKTKMKQLWCLTMKR